MIAQQLETPSPVGYGRRQIVGLMLGPMLLGLVCLLPTPDGLTLQAKNLLALIALMAVWWMTEAVPLAATSLLPLVLLPVLGIMTPEAAAVPYADPNIFLFLGGFLLAQAFQKWGLHRRVALLMLTVMGTQPRQLLLGCMLATAVISMWVSNTATAMMMLPIGLAAASRVGLESSDPQNRAAGDNFGAGLMLGIAYAASIGGMATLIGTPPNMIFAGQVRQLFPELGEVGFLRWMLVGVPLAGIYLLLTWLYLAFVVMRCSSGLQPHKSGQALSAQRAELGPMSRGERVVMTVFLLTVVAWVFRADLVLGPLTIPGWSTWAGLEVHDGTIAVAAALLLFLIPIDLQCGQFVLDWAWAVRIPWEVLFLFGGGFALATGFRVTGLAEWLAGGLQLLAVLPLGIMMLVLCLIVIFASEIASNTALASLLLPILAATARGLDIHPYLLMLPATLAASCGFMLPVATPPNAVAFASGYVTAPQMLRVGLVLDVLGAILVTLAVSTLGRAVFALD
jgi:solute carrier family 13 (sodium-dependent dicarboxylate transporter), member 2/3/5